MTRELLDVGKWIPSIAICAVIGFITVFSVSKINPDVAKWLVGLLENGAIYERIGAALSTLGLGCVIAAIGDLLFCKIEARQTPPTALRRALERVVGKVFYSARTDWRDYSTLNATAAILWGAKTGLPLATFSIPERVAIGATILRKSKSQREWDAACLWRDFHRGMFVVASIGAFLWGAKYWLLVGPIVGLVIIAIGLCACVFHARLAGGLTGTMGHIEASAAAEFLFDNPLHEIMRAKNSQSKDSESSSQSPVEIAVAAESAEIAQDTVGVAS